MIPAPGVAAAAVATSLALAAPPRPAVAQSADTLYLERLRGPVVLDGMPDEPAWADVAPLPLSMFSPTFGGELTERSDIRVAYDDEHIYVGARLYDSNPKGIRTNTLYRDQYSGDDLLAIILDTYDDHETASWFVVNPAGTRTDRALSSDAEFTSGDPMNPDWNTYWDVATVQREDGWYAEMRIPFSSLGFQDAGGEVVMGMIVYRFIARKNERQLFPAIPPNWPLAFAKPSRARRVVLRRVYGRRPLYAIPYALGGLGRVAQLDAGETRYGFDRHFTREVGLDLRYSPTSNLALDLTANTDFAQVEADDQQVNLGRFSLFFPEKRQFFQERSAIFEFNTGGPSRLFHSRRIGLTDDGAPVRLLGGARMVGRVGKTDFGFLGMQAAPLDTLSGETFGVLRLRREVFNPYSVVGALVTSRVGTGGEYNVAVGADAVVRASGDEYVTFKWAQTFGNEVDGGFADAARILARWERRNQVGFSYSAQFLRSGVGYDPGLGFTLRENFTSVGNELAYQWLSGPRSPFRTVGVGNAAEVFLRNGDGTVESAEVAPTVVAELKGGAEIGLTLRNSYESVRDSFLIADLTPVPPGEYRYHQVELEYQAARSGQIRPSIALSAGSFFDGSRVAVAAEPAWNPSRHLELGAQYAFNAIRFPGRDGALDIHLMRLRVRTALDVHLSFATFVQYNNTVDEVSVNARLRYNFREGQDLWVVYDEILNTARRGTTPREPVSHSRAFMIKYTHTLVF